MFKKEEIIINIRLILNFIFYPFWWIIKIIIEHYTNIKLLDLEKEKLKVQQEEAQKNRDLQLQLKKEDNNIRKYETDQKTKRLNMMLNSRRQIAELKWKANNPNPINNLTLLRKNKKGKKTK